MSFFNQEIPLEPSEIDEIWPLTCLDDAKEKLEFSTLYPDNSSPYTLPQIVELVGKSFTIFYESRRLAVNHGNSLSIDDAMNIGSMYRIAMQETIRQLTGDVKSGLGDTVALEEALDSVKSAYLIWGLAETTMLRPSHNSVVADLIEWVQSVSSAAAELSEAMKNLAEQGRAVEEDERYWPTVIANLLVGRFDVASRVLRTTSNFSEDMGLRRMTELLDMMNVHHLHSPSTAGYFVAAQAEIAKHRQRFQDHPALSFICELLLGGIEPFKKAASLLSGPWYEFLPAFILFRNPKATFAELEPLVVELYSVLSPLSTTPSSSEGSLVTKVVLDLMKMAYVSAIKKISASPGLRWLAAYLFNVIHLVVSEDNTPAGLEALTVRDELFVAYARDLFRTPNPVDLLKSAVALVLETTAYKNLAEQFVIVTANLNSLEDDRLVDVLLEVAEANYFYDAANKITFAKALICLRQHDAKEAINWALKNGTQTVTNAISQLVLNHHKPTEVFSMQTLDQLTDTIRESDGMLFLYHFMRYHQAVERRDVKECAEVLFGMITSNLAPFRYKLFLISNIASALDVTLTTSASKYENTPLIDADALVKLQRHVNLYQTQESIRCGSTMKDRANFENMNRQLAYLHLVINRALCSVCL